MLKEPTELLSIKNNDFASFKQFVDMEDRQTAKRLLSWYLKENCDNIRDFYQIFLAVLDRKNLISIKRTLNFIRQCKHLNIVDAITTARTKRNENALMLMCKWNEHHGILWILQEVKDKKVLQQLALETDVTGQSALHYLNESSDSRNFTAVINLIEPNVLKNALLTEDNKGCVPLHSNAVRTLQILHYYNDYKDRLTLLRKLIGSDYKTTKKIVMEIFANVENVDCAENIKLLFPYLKAAIKKYDSDFFKGLCDKLNVFKDDKMRTNLLNYQDEADISCHTTILQYSIQCDDDESNDIMGIIETVFSLHKTKGEWFRNLQKTNRTGKSAIYFAVKKSKNTVLNYVLSKLSAKEKQALINIKFVIKSEGISASDRHENISAHETSPILESIANVPLKYSCFRALTNTDEFKLDQITEGKTEEAKTDTTVVNQTTNKKQNIFHVICDKVPDYVNEYVSYLFESKLVSVNLLYDIDKSEKYPIQYSGNDPSAVQMMLDKCCKNDEEKLRMLCHYDKKGGNALMGSSTAFWTDYVKQTLTRNKFAFSIDLIIPIFLMGIQLQKIDFIEWILAEFSKIKSNDIDDLLYCVSAQGLTTIMAACQVGMATFTDVLAKYDTANNQRFTDYARQLDQNRYSAILYAMENGKVEQMTLLCDILGANVSDYLNTTDKDGNNIVQIAHGKCRLIRYLMKEINNPQKFIELLTMQNTFKETVIYKKSGVFGENEDEIIKILTKYIESIGTEYDMNITILSRLLMYFVRADEYTHLCKLIIETVQKENDTQLMTQLFAETNEEGETVLNLGITKYDITEYLLSDDIIPNNHEMLSKPDIDGWTPFMYLCRKGWLHFAQALINKIDDKTVRINMINAKDKFGRAAIERSPFQNVKAAIQKWTQTNEIYQE